MMLRTALSRQAGVDYPIIPAGMGPAAAPELATPVSNAGRVACWEGPRYRRRTFAGNPMTATLTAQPFGVNVIRAVRSTSLSWCSSGATRGSEHTSRGERWTDGRDVY
jgi:NAD(P)H-dependent flavin oxidoreductase YrpB (nitropropane dioxygenase family)